MSENKNYPLVSICMPLYNAEEYIEETLTRLIEQSYLNIEIIVVDDHSHDSSMEIVKSFESDKIKVFTNEGKGACSARNYAFSKASGEFIKFHDSDDYCSHRLIELQLKVLQSGTKSSVVFSPLKLLYPDGGFVDPVRTIDHDYEDAFDLQIEIMKFGGTNVPHCYMMPRELVEISGGWDETVRKNQDGEYFSRVLANADKAFSVTDEFAIYRKTGVGLSNKLSLEAVSSVLDTYKKVIGLALEKHNTDEMRKICGKHLGLFVFIYYSELKSRVSDVEKICEEFSVSLLLPERKVLKLLKLFVGWKNSVALMHKLGMVNSPE